MDDDRQEEVVMKFMLAVRDIIHELPDEVFISCIGSLVCTGVYTLINEAGEEAALDSIKFGFRQSGKAEPSFQTLH